MLDIHGQEVIAGFGSVAENLVEEVPRRAVLAHEAALHVRERGDNRINLPVRDLAAEGFNLDCHSMKPTIDGA